MIVNLRRHNATFKAIILKTINKKLHYIYTQHTYSYTYTYKYTLKNISNLGIEETLSQVWKPGP